MRARWAGSVNRAATRSAASAWSTICAGEPVAMPWTTPMVTGGAGGIGVCAWPRSGWMR
ncbi:Uncharacterised protein [Mycobacteroides abscessus subsp. abscessus]|nr:Uncharacterised protein [Mycobacteroides abscessus subsp. abscessus]